MGCRDNFELFKTNNYQSENAALCSINQPIIHLIKEVTLCRGVILFYINILFPRKFSLLA